MISWYVEIEAYDEECYLLRTPKVNTEDRIRPVLIADYGLITEVTPKPLMFYIMEEQHSRILYKRHGHASDDIKLTLRPQERYWMCLQNSNDEPGRVPDDDNDLGAHHPDGLTRKIGFSYKIILESHGEALVDAKTRDWNQDSLDVSRAIEQVEDAFRYLKVREAEHRQLAENNFSAVLMWTLLEVAVVIAAAVGQVLYFRRFLERKRSMMF